MDHPPVERLAYRVAEFCVASGLSRSTTYRLIAQKELPTVRVRGRHLIPAAAVRGLLGDDT